MQSVIGLDVSKGKSDGYAMIARNKPFGKKFCFEHSKSGFAEFLSQLQKVERESGSRPHVILEATGHYHLPVVAFLREYDYVVILSFEESKNGCGRCNAFGSIVLPR